MSKKQTPHVLPRPPIVAVLGHVDHGKTTLLDTIRKSHVAAGEHGGITQRIGAYQIEVDVQKHPQTITFIDTPGHEAFIQMRSRGATVADIVILVVAADDSVKPQTIESIKQIEKSGAKLIVAINKIDLPAANVDKVKQDLARAGVQVEGFGGDVPWVGVSAKQGTGVDKLLEMIILVAHMMELKDEKAMDVAVVVIETEIDKGKGMTASVIVKQGELTKGAQLYEYDTCIAKVRAMFDEYAQPVEQAQPSKPVEVLGFSKMPHVGAVLRAVPTDLPSVHTSASVEVQPQMPDFLKPIEEAQVNKLTLLIKADTAGSLEAITQALPDGITVVAQGVGDISEADITQAKACKAVVVGFNVKVTSSIARLARIEKVVFRTYNIIYKLLEEIGDVLTSMEDVLVEVRELGKGQIIAEFPFDNQRIAGTKVVSGRLAKGDTVTVLRGEEEVAHVRIKSLKQGKEDSTKAEAGTECGVLFDKKVDFMLQDGIIATTKS